MSSDGRSACRPASSRAGCRQSSHRDVHRFADAVGIEQEDIATAEGHRDFFEQPLEGVTRVELQARTMPSGVRTCAVRDTASGPGT